MFFSNTLSRAALPIPQVKPHTDSYQIFQIQEEHKYRREIEETDMQEALFVTDQRLDSIRRETTRDASLQTLMNTIKDGLPNSKAAAPLCIHEYWPYRYELASQDGLAYRGTRVIIPFSMRTEMTTRAHASHLGIQYTLNTARDIIYWPRMTADLTETVQRCNTCQETQPTLQKDVLPHRTVFLAW